MNLYPISFPNLNLSFFINPIAISIFGINIHWYGILIVSAILLGLFLAKKNDGLYKIKFDDVFDFCLIGIFIRNNLCKILLCFVQSRLLR